MEIQAIEGLEKSFLRKWEITRYQLLLTLVIGKQFLGQQTLESHICCTGAPRVWPSGQIQSHRSSGLPSQDKPWGYSRAVEWKINKQINKWGNFSPEQGVFSGVRVIQTENTQSLANKRSGKARLVIAHYLDVQMKDVVVMEIFDPFQNLLDVQFDLRIESIIKQLINKQLVKRESK